MGIWRKMMNKLFKKIGLITLILILVGCQLAQIENDETDQQEIEDTLIGLYIMKDVNNIPNSIKGELVMDENQNIESVTFGSSVGVIIMDYTFEDEENPYSYSWSSEEVIDMNTHLNVGDVTHTEISAKLLVWEAKEHLFKTYAVYQKEDGSIVARDDGHNLGFSGYEGSSISITMDQSVTMDEVVSSLKIETEIAYQSRPLSMTMIEMDSNNVMTHQVELNILDIPGEYKLQAESEYVILETVFEDQKITREIATNGEMLKVYNTLDNGYLVENILSVTK